MPLNEKEATRLVRLFIDLLDPEIQTILGKEYPKGICAYVNGGEGVKYGGSIGEIITFDLARIARENMPLLRIVVHELAHSYLFASKKFDLAEVCIFPTKYQQCEIHAQSLEASWINSILSDASKCARLREDMRSFVGLAAVASNRNRLVSGSFTQEPMNSPMGSLFCPEGWSKSCRWVFMPDFKLGHYPPVGALDSP